LIQSRTNFSKTNKSNIHANILEKKKASNWRLCAIKVKEERLRYLKGN
jgi:hypothetical protein